MRYVSLWRHKNFLKADFGDGCPTQNILKTTELYTLNGLNLIMLIMPQ